MIRKAISADAKELFILEYSIFSKDDFGLSLSSFYYHIKRNNLFVFIKGNKIVGYILWLERKKYFRLYSLCVNSNYRGLGIAQQLLEFSFACLAKEYYSLEVKATNLEAIRLYEKNGFTIQKILVNFYPNNVDGYLMIKS